MNVSFEQHASFRERTNVRRERRPGRRERHCLRSARFLAHESLSSNTMSMTSRTEPGSETLPKYTRNSPKIFRPSVHQAQHTSTPVQEEQVKDTIQYKYTEKESSQPKNSEFLFQEGFRPQTATQKIPSWLGDSDVHLDVTPIDIIPPFRSASGIIDASEDTYYNIPKVEIIYDDNAEFDDNDENVNDDVYSDDEKQMQKTNLKSLSKIATPADRSLSPNSDRRPLSEQRQWSLTERPFSARSLSSRTSVRSPTITGRTKSPRRYQGDMKVMSMQTGGIRSTPFQPESTKFINQMITYKNMKMHKKKMKKAKSVVDTRMPKTFVIALERKYLVESRLSDSWDQSYETSTPVSNNKSTTRSKHSNHKK